MESISLKWGAQLPTVGLGFWKVAREEAADICRTAIEIGYRHLDCACDYGNEVEVGQGIARAIHNGLCAREDLWVTSKLWNTYHAPKHVQPACEKILANLGLDYLDQYLIHYPIAQRFVSFERRYPPSWFYDPDEKGPSIETARVPMSETWDAIQDLARTGMVKQIGVCNVGTSQIRDLLSHATIRPALLQLESHPYLTQETLLRYCREEGIDCTTFSSLGAQSYFSRGMADPTKSVISDPLVQEIATQTSRSPAQVLLQWEVQRGTAVVPKTTRRNRLKETWLCLISI